jgi:hypothetical protein
LHIIASSFWLNKATPTALLMPSNCREAPVLP